MPDRVRLDRYLTPEQVAELVQISPKTVLAAVRRGELRDIRIGNRVRFAPDEVARWLKAKGGGR
jgi:excisionase family DNA binding protein